MKTISHILALLIIPFALACHGEISDPEIEPPAPPATLHRLTVSQYHNSVLDLFGEDITLPELEPDLKLHGYTSIATGELTVSPRAAELYEAAARDLSRQVVSDPDRRARVTGCLQPDALCLRAAFARLGRLAWRRPLSGAEIDMLIGIVDNADELLGDRWTGVQFGLAALLQSPYFVYRVELGVPDPKQGNRRRLDGYEMASRLSFVLWNRAPDSELLDAAERGELDDAEGVRRHAGRLLDDAKGRDALAGFFGEYLNLDRLAGLSKDSEQFPQMTPELAKGMHGELTRLFAYVVFDLDDDYRRIFSEPVAFVNAELATHYGVAPPAEDGAFEMRELGSDSARAGLLTTAGLMALYSHSAATSPTLRGRFVRQNLLCEDIAPPPPGVVTSLDEATGPTVRERLSAHANDPICAACHVKMDPIGLGFEAFDAIGGIRTEEAPGYPVDATGDLDGIAFDGARQLQELLAQDPRVPACFVRQLYRFATGHLESERELELVDELMVGFEASGNRVRDLVIAVAASKAFRYAATPLDQAQTTSEPAPPEESP